MEVEEAEAVPIGAHEVNYIAKGRAGGSRVGIVLEELLLVKGDRTSEKRG
jgi:hypothetical protein